MMRFWASVVIVAAACTPSTVGDNNTAIETDDVLMAADNALSAAADSLSNAGQTSSEADGPPSWIYSSNADPMSDEKTELACVQSSNSIYLSSPYGETGARLCLRNSPQFGRDAYVALNENGQILCNSYESCDVRIRFDKAPAEEWSAVGPSDNSSDMVFIENRSALERKLRGTGTTNVQIEFYRNGMQTFTFNTAGLKWGASKSTPDGGDE